MNRYLTRGVLRDMRTGRRVVVVCGTRWESRSALAAVARYLEPGERAFQGIGQERCEAASGGTVRFVPRTDLRGVSADVVVVNGHAPTLDERADLHVLASTGAEVIL